MSGRLPGTPPARGLFVTGTDTGIGKTTLCALLLEALRRAEIAAGYFKPAQTGGDSDTGTVARLTAAVPLADAVDARRADPVLAAPVYELPLPASPDRAAAAAGVAIRMEEIEAAWRSLPPRAWIVEGAGGLLVPLTARDTMRDLASLLSLPLLVVASTRLGTINHTLLTLAAARAGGVPVTGLVLNGPADPGLAETLARFDPAPVLAEIRPLEEVSPAAIRAAAPTLFPPALLRRLFPPA